MGLIILITEGTVEVGENKEQIRALIHSASIGHVKYIEVMKKITYFSGGFEYKKAYIMISSIVMWRDHNLKNKTTK